MKLEFEAGETITVDGRSVFIFEVSDKIYGKSLDQFDAHTKRWVARTWYLDGRYFSDRETDIDLLNMNMQLFYLYTFKDGTFGLYPTPDPLTNPDKIVRIILGRDKVRADMLYNKDAK